MSVNNFCIFWQVLPIWQVFSFVWFLQFGVGSPPGNENMVNTSIYLQSVFIPGAALLALFLPAFLSLPVFNQLCLLSPAWKVDNCLGSVNCWQPQPLISNKCFKMAGNFSTISSLFSFFFFRICLLMLSDITFHRSSICPVCYKLARSSFDKLLQLTERISSKLTERISSKVHTTQTSRTAWKRCQLQFRVKESYHQCKLSLSCASYHACCMKKFHFSINKFNTLYFILCCLYISYNSITTSN